MNGGCSRYDLQPLAPTPPKGNPGTAAELARPPDKGYMIALTTNVDDHVVVNTSATVGVIED